MSKWGWKSNIPSPFDLSRRLVTRKRYLCLYLHTHTHTHTYIYNVRIYQSGKYTQWHFSVNKQPEDRATGYRASEEVSQVTSSHFVRKPQTAGPAIRNCSLNGTWWTTRITLRCAWPHHTCIEGAWVRLHLFLTSLSDGGYPLNRRLGGGGGAQPL